MTSRRLARGAIIDERDRLFPGEGTRSFSWTLGAYRARCPRGSEGVGREHGIRDGRVSEADASVLQATGGLGRRKKRIDAAPRYYRRERRGGKGGFDGFTWHLEIFHRPRGRPLGSLSGHFGRLLRAA